MAQAENGAAKIALVLKPMNDGLRNEIKEHITAATQEILLALARMETRLDVLEKLHAEKRKPVAPREKKPAGEVATEDVPRVIQATADKKFPMNKLVWFRSHFKDDETFRKKYMTAEIQALPDLATAVAGKNEQGKIVAQATFCWNYIKANQPAVSTLISEEYEADKKVYEQANKPPQQTAETHTPPAELADGQSPV